MRNMLTGPNVKLTALREDDLEVIEGWFNNVEFLRYYDMLPALPKPAKEVKKMLDYFDESSERYIFALRSSRSAEIIGILGFDDIIWSNRVATLFIGIGHASYAGQGLGKEALQLLLDFGFNELNLYRIQLNVIAYNEVAKRLYENLGFRREGQLRSFIERDGQRHDLYLYGLLKEEWQSR